MQGKDRWPYSARALSKSARTAAWPSKSFTAARLAPPVSTRPSRIASYTARPHMLLLRHQNRPVVLVTGAIELVADIDADRAPANLSCVVERTLA